MIIVLRIIINKNNDLDHWWFNMIDYEGKDVNDNGNEDDSVGVDNDDVEFLNGSGVVVVLLIMMGLIVIAIVVFMM